MNSNEDVIQIWTPEQVQLLQQFRSRVQDVITPIADDQFLMRFLRARRFHLEKVEKMFREHMKFRRNIGMDTILNDYDIPKVVLKHFPYYFVGFDKDGDAIMSFLTGMIDCKGFFNSMTVLDVTKCLVYYVEAALKKMQEENKRTGRNASRLIIIFDMNGLQVRQVMDRIVGKQVIDFLLTFEANYPERLKTVYTINVPSFFNTWFSVLKRFADPEPIKKFVIYSRDGWKEDMLKVIDADILPAIFGGNVTDPDGNPDCKTLLTRENKIPTNCYLKSNKTEFVDDPSMTEVVVRERTYYNHAVQVKEPKSVVRWFFQTKEFNIAFAVYYIPSGVKPMPRTSIPKFSKSFRHRVRRNSKDGHDIIVPSERVESHIIPEQGEIICEETGTYMIHFDNTFSWMTPKTLWYKIEVLPPNTTVMDIEQPCPLSEFCEPMSEKQMLEVEL